MKKYIIILLGSIALFSCQPKDKFSWNAGLSGPKNYPSGAPVVRFFYQGKSISGASSGTGADQGWGVTSGGYVGGDKYKAVPDSVSVRWVCSVDNLVYEKGFALPREKMLALFKQGATDEQGKKQHYGTLVAGMAPGGNVTIWMQGAGGGISTEIIKLKIPNGFDDPNIDVSYKRKDVRYWADYLTYWYIHGIPYSVWEDGEKEYEYDIGFASENNNLIPSIVTLRSKDGSWYQPQFNGGKSFSIDLTSYDKFEYLENNNLVKKHKIPVQIKIQFENNSKYYSSNIVMPNDFEKYFSELNYDRITIGLNQDGLYGKVWVEGKQGRYEIMKFKVFEARRNSTDSPILNNYSLPKGFVFPKWEGREKLTFPDIEFWQE